VGTSFELGVGQGEIASGDSNTVTELQRNGAEGFYDRVGIGKG